MMRQFLLAGSFALLVTVAPGSAVCAIASDQAPGPEEQMLNPSKSEPMMIEPSRTDENAAYWNDIVECDSHSVEGRQICRDMVNEQYGLTNSAAEGTRCGGPEPAQCIDGESAREQ